MLRSGCLHIYLQFILMWYRQISGLSTRQKYISKSLYFLVAQILGSGKSRLSSIMPPLTNYAAVTKQEWGSNSTSSRHSSYPFMITPMFLQTNKNSINYAISQFLLINITVCICVYFVLLIKL